MKRIVIALIALMLLVGCARVEIAEPTKTGKTSRFITVETTSSWKVVVDKETELKRRKNGDNHIFQKYQP